MSDLKQVVRRYTNGEHAKRAIHLRQNAFEPSRMPIREDLLHGCNYMVTQLLLHNSKRAGPIKNMLLKDYHDRCLVPSESNCILKPSYIIKVLTHKTYSKHGSSCVVLDNHMFDNLVAYVDARNMHFSHDDCDYVFTTKSGSRLSSSDPSKILKLSLQDQQATLSRLPKLTVTMAKESGANDSQMSLLSRHMTHSREVQDSCYDVSQWEKVVKSRPFC